MPDEPRDRSDRARPSRSRADSSRPAHDRPETYRRDSDHHDGDDRPTTMFDPLLPRAARDTPPSTGDRAPQQGRSTRRVASVLDVDSDERGAPRRAPDGHRQRLMLLIAGTVVVLVAMIALATRNRDDATKPAATTTEAPQPSDKVTFPEGFNLRQMGARVHRNAPQLSAETFTALATGGTIASSLRPAGVTSLEGLLFPDTYLLPATITEDAIIREMASLMERVATEEGVAAGAAARGVRPYDIMIVASMIEKEAKTGVDRSLVASVIWNRIAAGMPLQIDATLYYGQDPDTKFSKLRQIDSPYNTYKNKGLPPTPIANPGRASIQAALRPAPDPAPTDAVCQGLPAGQACKYYFYVLDTPDTHVFAVTYEQHQVNVEAARQAGLLG